MEPINTRALAPAARAYVRLGWPLTIGQRLRPRQGCTCGNLKCPAPGAHPLLEPVPRITEDTVEAALQTVPGGSLIAATTHFDAVLVPYRLAMAVLVQLDRIHPVPCLVAHGVTAAFLVLPATGRYAAVHEQVEVRTGPNGWLALPPSHGIRWDTPPWVEATNTPRMLVNGQDVGRELRRILPMATGTPPEEILR